MRLEEAIALEPGNVTANYRLGALALQRREPAAALAYLQTVLAVRPSWPEAHFAAGMAHDMSGARDAARKAFEHALQLQPDSQRFQDAVLRSGGTIADSMSKQPRAHALTP